MLVLLLGALGLQPAWAQSKALPSLGNSEGISLGAERKLGDRIARELYRDPDYLDDPVIMEYVQGIWQPLLAAARAIASTLAGTSAAASMSGAEGDHVSSRCESRNRSVAARVSRSPSISTRTPGRCSSIRASAAPCSSGSPPVRRNLRKPRLDAALAMAGLDAQAIDFVNLHGTASERNDEVEAALGARRYAATTHACATKGLTGHTMGAAGLLEAVVCLLAGYLFGRPALKLEGLYLALATFALAVATPQLLKYKHLEAWTGGVQGIVLMKPDAPWGLPLTQDQWLYLFALAVAVVMFWLAHNLLQSGTGRAMRAIRDHAMAAEAMGVDNRHYKSMTFGVSAAYTGVGGALSAIAVQFVSPDSFTLFLSISLLVGIVVGGVGTLWGALYGAIFIMFVPNLAEKVSKAAPWAVYGVVLILLMFAMPGGVVGLLRKLQAWRAARSH